MGETLFFGALVDHSNRYRNPNTAAMFGRLNWVNVIGYLPVRSWSGPVFLPPFSATKSRLEIVERSHGVYTVINSWIKMNL